MPYVRTPRACVWIDDPATGEQPEKTAPHASEIQWAKKPLACARGLCIGVIHTEHGVVVVVKRATTTYRFPAGQVLRPGELADWLRTGFDRR